MLSFLGSLSLLALGMFAQWAISHTSPRRRIETRAVTEFVDRIENNLIDAAFTARDYHRVCELLAEQTAEFRPIALIVAGQRAEKTLEEAAPLVGRAVDVHA